MRMFHAYLWMFPSHLLPHQPTHTHIHPEMNPRKGGAFPFVEAARSAAPFMDGCVWDGEAVDAMETSINMYETRSCMHIIRNSCGYDISYLFIPALFRLIQDYSRLFQYYFGLIQVYSGLIQAYSGLVQAYSGLIQAHSGLLQLILA